MLEIYHGKGIREEMETKECIGSMKGLVETDDGEDGLLKVLGYTMSGGQGMDCWKETKLLSHGSSSKVM